MLLLVLLPTRPTVWMEATVLSRLPLLLLMVACATSMALVRGRGAAGERVERGCYLVLSKVVG